MPLLYQIRTLNSYYETRIAGKLDSNSNALDHSESEQCLDARAQEGRGRIPRTAIICAGPAEIDVRRLCTVAGPRRQNDRAPKDPHGAPTGAR